jgi:hypothetical protein
MLLELKVQQHTDSLLVSGSKVMQSQIASSSAAAYGNKPALTSALEDASRGVSWQARSDVATRISVRIVSDSSIASVFNEAAFHLFCILYKYCVSISSSIGLSLNGICIGSPLGLCCKSSYVYQSLYNTCSIM